MKKENRFTEVCMLDVCFSDYFTGYHMPVVAVPVYETMTAQQLSEAIQDEINATWEYLCDEDNKEYTYTEEEMEIFDAYCEELAKDGDAVAIDSIQVEEDEECAYAYFALCSPVKRYGITFLNA